MEKSVKFGSYIIIPLKYEKEEFREEILKERFEAYPVSTMDVNENVKEMFNGSHNASGSCYKVKREDLCAAFDGVNSFKVEKAGDTYSFKIEDSYLYIYFTQVAFLCLQIRYEDMRAVHAICNPGSAMNTARFSMADQAGNEKVFSMETWLGDFLEPLCLKKFFDGNSSYLLDAYTYLLALFPERFRTLEEMKRLTFNLHQMMPLDTLVEDDSEADIRYVYAVKVQSLNSYRWGCCVASQTISYVVADEEMDIAAEMDVQACDGLPVVTLALYQKYTCLRFTQLISALEGRKMSRVKELKKMMLRFQAFGTVLPAGLSRWHNVKQIYGYILEVNDISTAVSDVSAKVSILAERQEELERSRNEMFINLITLFGVISILASVLDIIQILSGGGTAVWATMIFTNIALVLCIAGVLWVNRR